MLSLLFQSHFVSRDELLLSFAFPTVRPAVLKKKGLTVPSTSWDCKAL